MYFNLSVIAMVNRNLHDPFYEVGVQVKLEVGHEVGGDERKCMVCI